MSTILIELNLEHIEKFCWITEDIVKDLSQELAPEISIHDSEKYTHESKIVKMVTTSKLKFIEHRGENLNPEDPLTLYSDSLSNE